MIWNTPNSLTIFRLVLIPLFIAAYYWPKPWGRELATVLFILAAATDWLDGYFARRLNQGSRFGAFLDPVADKLMVVAALVLLISDQNVHAYLGSHKTLFDMTVVVILGREIAVSALREWMAEVGRRSQVKVALIGKIKTTSQMLAIPFLLWRHKIGAIPMFQVGEWLLYIAAALTLWSMLVYLKAAWPSLIQPGPPAA